MEHTNEDNLYTERYLLNEMPSEERQAFEEHFFNCRICSDDVTAAARMLAAGHREVVADESRKVVPIQRMWLQTAAAAVMAAGLTWFAAMPRFAAIPQVASVKITSGAPKDIAFIQVRGEQTGQTLKIRVPYTLDFEIPPEAAAASYVWSIRNAGKTLYEERVPLEKAEELVYVHLHALPRGVYEVVVEGVRKDGNRFSTTRKPVVFEVIGER